MGTRRQDRAGEHGWAPWAPCKWPGGCGAGGGRAPGNRACCASATRGRRSSTPSTGLPDPPSCRFRSPIQPLPAPGASLASDPRPFSQPRVISDPLCTKPFLRGFLRGLGLGSPARPPCAFLPQRRHMGDLFQDGVCPFLLPLQDSPRGLWVAFHPTPTAFPLLSRWDFPRASGILPPGFRCPLTLSVGSLDPAVFSAPAALRFHRPCELETWLGWLCGSELSPHAEARAPLKAKAVVIRCALDLPEEGNGNPVRLGRPLPRSLPSSRVARKPASPFSLGPGARGTPASGS